MPSVSVGHMSRIHRGLETGLKMLSSLPGTGTSSDETSDIADSVFWDVRGGIFYFVKIKLHFMQAMV